MFDKMKDKKQIKRRYKENNIKIERELINSKTYRNTF